MHCQKKKKEMEPDAVRCCLFPEHSEGARWQGGSLGWRELTAMTELHVRSRLTDLYYLFPGLRCSRSAEQAHLLPCWESSRGKSLGVNVSEWFVFNLM